MSKLILAGLLFTGSLFAGDLNVVTAYTNNTCSGNAFVAFLLNGEASGDKARCNQISTGTYAYSYKVDDGACVVPDGLSAYYLCFRLAGVSN